MKEFVTSTQAIEREGALTFTHDGREVTFYEPKAGQVAVMMATSTNKTEEMVTIVTQFFFSVMDEDDIPYFRDRLMDPSDSFDFDSEGGVLDIYYYLMDEWSGKGEKQPSDYLPPSPKKTSGRSSTGNTRAKASTSSRSRSTASSTSRKRG